MNGKIKDLSNFYKIIIMSLIIIVFSMIAYFYYSTIPEIFFAKYKERLSIINDVFHKNQTFDKIINDLLRLGPKMSKPQ